MKTWAFFEQYRKKDQMKQEGSALDSGGILPRGSACVALQIGLNRLQ